MAIRRHPSSIDMQNTPAVPLPIPIPTMAAASPALPSLESLATMHSSTVSTLVDLFTLALTHPGRGDDRELKEAKKRVDELEEEVRHLREVKSAAVSAAEVSRDES